MENNTLTEIIGIAAGVCTAISLLPQIVKMVKEKKAQDISLFYLIVLLCGLDFGRIMDFSRRTCPSSRRISFRWF